MAQQRPVEREVTCVKKHPQLDRHKGITHLGGKGWQMTRWQVTAAINSGGETFYTQVDGKRAVLQVVDDPEAAYVRAVIDDQWSDDLLALPECPTIAPPPRTQPQR
ncbi:MAG: DUF3892 domain-containing protein [Thermomicrobiales bacterium]